MNDYLMTKMSRVTAAMRETKSGWVEKSPENTDLASYLHFFRGEQMVSTVLCPGHMGTMLQAALIGAIGFAPDAMTLTFESIDESENEFLSTVVHDRDGGWLAQAQQYQIEDGKVLWLTVTDGGNDDSYTDQPLCAAMQEAMRQPTMHRQIENQITQAADSLLTVVADQLSEEEKVFHEDMSTYQALVDADAVIAVVLLADPGSDREQWLQERLGPDRRL